MSSEPEALGQLIKRVQYRHHRALETQLGQVGTSLAQWDALRAIAHWPGATAQALAQATFQSAQAFGTLAGRLEAQGLIERRPGRGRRIEHLLTPAGQRTLEAGHPVLSDVLGASFADLSAQERATLAQLLSRVAGEPLGG